MLKNSRKVKRKSSSSRKKHFKNTAVCLSLILLFFYPNLFVFISEDNKTLSTHFLLPGEGFSLIYNHSVEKTPVQEIYLQKIRGGFIMDRTVFQSYGAGLPLESRNFSIAENNFIIEDMNIKLSSLRIRVSRTPGQIIKIGEEEYTLQEISRPGKLLILKNGSLYTLLQSILAF